MNSTEPRKKSFFSHLRPERLFLTIGISMGVLLCFFLPYGVGIDENFFLIRIFDISGLHFVPNRSAEAGNYTLSQFNTLSYMSSAIRTSAAGNFSPEVFWQKPDWQNMDHVYTTSTYFAFLYLPQAVIAGIAWRLLNLPLLPVIILMRLVGLALYLLAGYYALKLLPYGKWVFFVLALAPQPLYQASTLNGDWFTNGACFLFMAAVLYVFSKKEMPISRKDSWILAATTLLVGLAKPFAIIILPLLSILLRKGVKSPASLAIILGGVVVSIGISMGWSFYYFLNTVAQLTKESRSQHILLALQNLGDFLPMYFRNIAIMGKQYFTEWIGVYKYWRDQVPAAVYILFMLALVLAYFTETKKADFPLWLRILVSVFAIGLLLAYGSETVLLRYTPGEQRYEAQGRYLVEYAPLLFLAWAGTFPVSQKIRKWSIPVTAGMVILLLGIYGFGAWRTFYSVCLHAVNKENACVLPLYWDLDVENPQYVALQDTHMISQSFTPTCSHIKNIQLRVDEPEADLSGNLQMQLFDAGGNVLTTTSLQIQHWKALQQITLPFDTINLQAGQPYQFVLTLDSQASTPAALKLLAILADDYQDGQLLINGDTSATYSDLFFEYECVR